MDLKRAIIYGFLSWLFICIISSIIAPFLDIDSLPYINLSIPITIIVVTGFFGILYIREFNEHERKSKCYCRTILHPFGFYVCTNDINNNIYRLFSSNDNKFKVIL